MTSPIEIPPIVAILRGVRPEEILDIAEALISGGIRAIEIPLNSPDPLTSIERLTAAHGSACLCGAGTVLTATQVDQVKAAGGSLIVSPNTDARVIEHAVSLGLAVIPGFATATEAFTAIEAGARHLKLFPAGTYGTAHLKALRAVLPNDVRVYAVGGVSTRNLPEWIAAGAAGVGVGTDIFRPGQPAKDVARQAAHFVAAWQGQLIT
jgi:2-dehydro-3-deoxyphosphogalactonate aldolase